MNKSLINDVGILQNWECELIINEIQEVTNSVLTQNLQLFISKLNVITNITNITILSRYYKSEA